MKPVVFLGPTMPVEEAAQLVDAVFLPPVRQGDVLSAIERYHPAAIGIIDGFFLQDLSVWHKEILWAMEQGITVLGSSSMGALRAAELHALGMVGVGWVFEQYAAGAIEDDDEVVLAHGPAESGYRKIAEPLVNIRATLAAAVSRCVITAAHAEELVGAMKKLYFPERTKRRLFAEAAAILDSSELEELRRFFDSHYVDVKRDDARLLMRKLAAGDFERRSHDATVRSLRFETLYQRDRRVQAGEREVSLGQIVRYAALHLDSFEAVRMHAANRALTAMMADLLGIAISDADVETQRKRFCYARRISGRADLEEWLHKNDLSMAEFEELLRTAAKCEAAQNWWRSTSGHRGAQAKAVLDEMRLEGLYPRVAADAATQREKAEIFDHLADGEDSTADTLRKATSEFAELTGFRVAMPLHQWAEDAGFLGLQDLHGELVTAVAAATSASPGHHRR